MTPELSLQRNDAITHYTCSIISHWEIVLGSFLLQYSRLDVREVKTESV